MNQALYAHMNNKRKMKKNKKKLIMKNACAYQQTFVLNAYLCERTFNHFAVLLLLVS
jgi:hypothetical protein